MISITSVEFDIEGAIEFEENKSKTKYGTPSRRGNRVATLDGGAVLQDRGYSNSDLDFSITALAYSEAVFSRLKELMVLSPIQRISTRNGVYLGRIKDINSETFKFNFEVLSDG